MRRLFSLFLFLLLFLMSVSAQRFSQLSAEDAPNSNGFEGLPSVMPAIVPAKEDREGERLDIELAKKKLEVEKRDYREGRLWTLRREENVKVLPTATCRSGRTDVLLDEDFSCSDAIQRKDNAAAKLFANRGKEYAYLTLDVGRITANAATLVLRHAVENPFHQRFSVYADVDGVWVPVCVQFTASRELSESRCDLSDVLARHPGIRRVRVEAYADGPAVWTVESAYVAGVAESAASVNPVPAWRITDPTSPVGAIPKGQSPPSGAGGGVPGSETRDGAANLKGEPAFTFEPSFAPAVALFGGGPVESAAEAGNTVPENEQGSILTGAAVGPLGRGNLLVGTLFVAMLVIVILGAYGQRYGRWVLRHKRRKAL